MDGVGAGKAKSLVSLLPHKIDIEFISLWCIFNTNNRMLDRIYKPTISRQKGLDVVLVIRITRAVLKMKRSL